MSSPSFPVRTLAPASPVSESFPSPPVTFSRRRSESVPPMAVPTPGAGPAAGPSTTVTPAVSAE